MQNLLPPTHLDLSQAITHLSKLDPSSDAARQTIEVIVKHLSNNQISLTRSSSSASPTITLPQTLLQGATIDGKPHNIKVSLEPNARLEFYVSTGPSEQKTIKLTEGQLNQLLSVAPKQLFSEFTAANNRILKALPTIQAVVVEQPSTLTQTQQPIDKVTLRTDQPTNNAAANHLPAATTFQLKILDSRPPINLTLPLKPNLNLAAGDKAILSLIPKANNWQLSVQGPSEKSLAPNFSAPNNQAIGNVTTQTTNQQLFVLPVKENVAILTHLLKESPNQNIKQLDIPVKAALKQLSQQPTAENQKVIQQLSSQALQKLSVKIEHSNQGVLTFNANKPIATLPITKAIAQQLAPLQLPQQKILDKALISPPQQSLAQQLTAPLLKVDVNTKKTPIRQSVLHTIEHVIRTFTNKPDTSVPNALILKSSALPPIWDALNLMANKARDIFNVPLSSTTSVLNKLSPDATLQVKALNQHVQSARVENTDTNSKVAVNTDIQKAQQNQTNTKVVASPPASTSEVKTEPPIKREELASALMQKVTASPEATSLISPSLLDNKPQQNQLLQQLLRIVQPKAHRPDIPLTNIEKMATDKDLNQASTEANVKHIIEQTIQQTKAAIPQGKEQDAQTIRQLFNSPALQLSTSQLTSTVNQQGLVGGLLTLIQVSLSARMARVQNNRSDIIARALNTVLPVTTKGKPNINAKGLNEFSQLEQKHQLLREIGRLLSSHQSNKISNAEQILQGQDSFYYNLPTLMGGTFKNAELLIKREENTEQQQQKEGSHNQTWQLTMKFSVGDIGELLSKANLRPDELEVNFYASNDQVKHQVMNYLPLLKRRLQALGIEVSKSQCQLGKIPDSLQARPYHVFQTKV